MLFKYLFDDSYIDCRFRTKISRQLNYLEYKTKNKIVKKIFILFSSLQEKILPIHYTLNLGKISKTIHKEKKEDLTIDGYINKYGSIYNHADGKNYTTKKTYLDALKKTGHHIKDY